VQLGRIAVHDEPLAGHAEFGQPVTQSRADGAGPDHQDVADFKPVDLLGTGRRVVALGEVPQRQAARPGSVPMPESEEGSGPEAGGEPASEHRSLGAAGSDRFGGQGGGEAVGAKVVVEPSGHG
jgi:hypothetical protein